MVQSGEFRFKSWWWVAAFCCLSVFTYVQLIQPKKRALEDLASRMEKMAAEKENCEQLNKELLLAVASQEDPAWIEMILMRDLGVVPEGWLKVHFKR